MSFNSITLLLVIIASVFFIVLRLPMSKLFEEFNYINLIAVLIVLAIITLVSFAFSTADTAFSRAHNLFDYEIFNE